MFRCEDGKRERQKRYRRGRRGEAWAVLALRMKGYLIAGRRVSTPAGEIDFVAVRGRRLAFVEVKRCRTRADAEASIGPAQRRRVHRAADQWLGRNARFREMEMGFDLVFAVPWRWPEHLVNAL